MKRKNLTAYIIGAGVSGTIITLPYIALSFWKIYISNLREIYVPIFILPLVWGFWNWLYIRLHQPFNIGAWGALLGFILAFSVLLLFYIQDQWFSAALILPLFAAAFYYILWLMFIGPLNHEAEVYD